MGIENEEEQEVEDPKVGKIYKGQRWVELRGIFYADELRSIAKEIDRLCKGVPKNNGDTG